MVQGISDTLTFFFLPMYLRIWIKQMYLGFAILFSGCLMMQFLTGLFCSYPSLHSDFITAKSSFSLLDFQTVSLNQA